MLYVAGVGGVFRSTNNGTNWTAFPDQTLATPVADGNLPAATISDLDMVLGNIDPTTGHPDVSTGPNLLLATTYGSGSYGIRLAPIIFNDNVNKVTETAEHRHRRSHLRRPERAERLRHGRGGHRRGRHRPEQPDLPRRVQRRRRQHAVDEPDVQ